jgi:hypothetical protein
VDGSIVYPELIAAGALGGLVHAFRAKNPRPWEVVGLIVTGGVAANFITPQVLLMANFIIPGALKMLTSVPPEFVALGVGLSGKRLCYHLEKLFDKLTELGKTRNG